jgi:2,5-diketo-D-gluconate reductase A
MSELRKAVFQLPRIKRDDGTHIPQLGFGVWPVWNEEVTPAATEAIRAGDA